MLLAESLARIDAVQAGSGAGLLVRLRGRGPGPGRLPAQLLIVVAGRTQAFGPLPDGGPPPPEGTWRLAFALPALPAGARVLLAHGDERPVTLHLEPPMSPEVAARLAELESELAASRRRRDLTEARRSALEDELRAASEELALARGDLAEWQRRCTERTAAARVAAARAAKLEADLGALLRERRRSDRAAERGQRDDQQDTRELDLDALEDRLDDDPPALTLRRRPEAQTASPPSGARGGRAAPLAAALAVATAAALLLQASGGGDEEARRASAVAATQRPEPRPSRARGYERLYREAGARYGLDWRVLAAIGELESRHGTLPMPGVRTGTSAAGAAGPMQFTRRSDPAAGYAEAVLAAARRTPARPPRAAVPRRTGAPRG